MFDTVSSSRVAAESYNVVTDGELHAPHDRYSYRRESYRCVVSQSWGVHTERAGDEGEDMGKRVNELVLPTLWERCHPIDLLNHQPCAQEAPQEGYTSA